MVNIQSKMPVGQLERISPSKYCSLKRCALKEIWSANRVPVLLPSSPMAKFGTAIHKMLELVNQGNVTHQKELDGIWERIIGLIEKEMLEQEFEKHFVPLKKLVRNYEGRRRMAFALANKILKTKGFGGGGKSGASVESEVWVESKNGKLGGKIDLILHSQSGDEITDYKTGKILENDAEDSPVKQEYQTQLFLYAAIYFEARGVWPQKLTLVGLDGTVHEVPFKREVCKKISDEAKALLDEINHKLREGYDIEELANPLAETCHYCGYRPSCKSYWQKRNDGGNWPIDIAGNVVQKKMLGNGTFRVTIDTGGKSIAIRGLSPKRHRILNEHVDKVMFCNLGIDAVEDRYIETPLTVGYGMEE